MKILTSIETKKGNVFEVLLPAKHSVCWRCFGCGVHDHEAFSNGISPQEFDEDPDFAEQYFRGDYDVPCSVCKGLRVILEVDTEQLSPKMLERFYRAEEAKARNEAEDRAERRAVGEY